jgi:DNA-binding transcriptional LysR family regulator/predicted ATPase
MQVEARLRAFAAVARTGSFSRAAEELYVSQPAVSKHVASLEAELGTSLFVRSRAGATLTPAGASLADYVLRAEALLANARRALGSEPETGVLALAASGIPGTYLLPEPLAAFHAAYPRIDVEFRLLTSGEALELVRAHRVELAVVGGLDAPAELASEPLVEDELVLAGPPALGGRRLRPQDIAGQTWISREEGSSTRAAVEAARWQLGLHAVRTLELPSWEAVKRAVARGAGITAISRFALDLELQAGALTILDVPRWRVSRTISVIRARGVPLTPPAERFLAMLRQTYVGTDGAVALPPNSNLPAPPNALIGRQRELDEVRRLVRSSRSRIVTLTGAGGSGKTRVALEVAASLVDDFRDGVYLVELAPLADPPLVESAILRVLGAKAHADLAGRHVLLVVDNFEHVVEAAPAIAEFVGATDHLRVLVTSRSPLALRGEALYEIAPLATTDAVALFVERALAADEAFEDDGSVRTICERLDRLPLAVELAAARVRVLPPNVLVDRLAQRLPVLVGGAHDLPARQHTMRGTIEWSHDLLDAPARRAFARLAVFRGGWTRDAAATACEVDDAALQTLVDQSLVRPDGDRYTMLETVREYAVERLGEEEDAEDLRRRHAAYFHDLAGEARGFARGPEQQEWFDRLELEQANLRAALGWATDAQVDLALKLADALEPLWTRRHHREALLVLDPLIRASAGARTGARAGVLTVAGTLATESERQDDAERWLEEAVALARDLGDRERMAWAFKGLSRLSFARGDLAEARRRSEESLALFEQLEDWVPVGGRLNDLAMISRASGDLDEARAFMERALAISRASGDPHGPPGDLHTLGDIELDAENFERARRLFTEALELTLQISERYQTAHCLAGLAAVAGATGEPRVAANIWSAVLAWERDSGQVVERSSRPRYVELIGDAHGDPVSWDEALALAREISSGESTTI